jgi:hypothetical protein
MRSVDHLQQIIKLQNKAFIQLGVIFILSCIEWICGHGLFICLQYGFRATIRVLCEWNGSI